MSKVFVVSAPSGVGKTTLVNSALDKIDSLSKIITATSRQPRPDEVDGVDYIFMDKSEMAKKFADGEFVEMVESYGNYYGTLKSVVDGLLEQNKDLIVVLDVRGKLSFDRLYDTIGIYITPPSMEVLNKRLIDRYGSELTEELVLENSKRLALAQTELKLAGEGNYNYTIDGNLPLEDCINQFYGIIYNEIHGLTSLSKCYDHQDSEGIH